ncbi:MAG: response regulator transcription factor [Solirubrobacterales bacterium]|nr:response regulator transcription factor [Solirubrobacterales bacterium]
MSSSSRPTVLIIEDDAATRRFIADNLSADGYEPLEADSAGSGRRILAGDRPALAILDLGLPDRDGLELLAELRDRDRGHGELDPHLPVLVVSGRGTELDRIRGLARGADDYLPKPFGYGELRERVAALLRRSKMRGLAGRIRVGELELDAMAREVWVEGREVYLAKKEFALLRALAAAPTRVFAREQLLRDVWGFRSPGRTRTLDSHASRLRRKLSTPRSAFVVNVWGVGYRLIDGEVED